MDASNLLKPQLARGELHCVGATTLAEYRKYIEKDPALARRFQPVLVSEPSVETTITMLRGLKERYEIHHGVRITDDAIVAAAVYSNRYITDRFLPDKAIDLIDESASRLRLQQESKPEEIELLDRAIITLNIERAALQKEKDPNSRERLKKITRELDEKGRTLDELMQKWHAERELLQKEKSAKAKLEEAKRELDNAQRRGDWSRASELAYGVIPEYEALLKKKSKSSNAATNMVRDAVTAKDIAEVVGRMTGIPVSNLLMGEKEKLVHMESVLAGTVVGQEEAVSAVSNAMRISRAGLHAHERPLGSFLFLGPTGVGKTELCKALAEFMFDSPQSMIRIDMSEYMEKFSVSRLIGAPPGYVGYEEGGVLTEAVRRRPYSLVLFDEFEKAHREVSNILLQVLDEGRLTDSQGRKIDFRNTFIIMTSNLGAESLASLPEGANSSDARESVMSVVKSQFPPEFLNRIDDIILFNRLSPKLMHRIVDIQVKKLENLMYEKKIVLDVSTQARDWLANHGYDVTYGARPLKRVIQKAILNPLATKMIEGTIGDADRVTIVVKGEALDFEVEKGVAKQFLEEVEEESKEKENSA
jgi:ATP-dependent Clp protease ATP-binding subunit ClpB